MKKSDLPTIKTQEEVDEAPAGSIVNFVSAEHPDGVVCRVTDCGGDGKIASPFVNRISRKVKKDRNFVHKDGRALLRIKIKSMGEEQRIIRHEEQRTPSLSRYLELYRHRMRLRLKIRAALLAYAFVRGRDPQRVDPTLFTALTPSEVKEVVEEVSRLVHKYGSRELEAQFATAEAMNIDAINTLASSPAAAAPRARVVGEPRIKVTA